MTTAARDIALRAPKSGPWIIGYAASIAITFVAGANGLIAGPRAAIPFWIAILACTGMIIYTSWRRHRMLGTLSKAIKTFWVRIVLSAGFMFASYCLLAYAEMVGQWDDAAIELVAVLPNFGFAGMIWSVHQYWVDEKDEYLRARAARQLLIASFTALIGAAIWSAAATAGMVTPGHIGSVILLWFGGLGIGRLVNELRP